jgi:uncharacterized membrane protein YqhA
MFSRLLSLTRFTILIPILGSWAAALLSLIFGGYEVGMTILSLFNGLDEKKMKMLVLNLVEAVDLFLLGTAFYLISLGLYELFIDENAPVPNWLEIHDLETLKNKLLNVIIVVLSVQFLAQVLGWKGEASILSLGLSIAVVIVALAFFIAQNGKKKGKVEDNTKLPSSN